MKDVGSLLPSAPPKHGKFVSGFQGYDSANDTRHTPSTDLTWTYSRNTWLGGGLGTWEAEEPQLGGKTKTWHGAGVETKSGHEATVIMVEIDIHVNREP